MSFERIEAFGWKQCARFWTPQAELIITLDVGPRILSYKTAGTENIFRTFDEQLGSSGELEWTPRGGHRMWIAPETDRTYELDNDPVEYTLEAPDQLRVSAPLRDPWKIRKEMTLHLSSEDSSVRLRHVATNLGSEPATLATWALTVAVPGGRLLIPHPPLRPHGPDTFLPNRSLVLWPYTDLTDGRWTVGKRYLMLRPLPDAPPTKAGLALRPGWIVYLLPNAVFFKIFAYEEGATYPDLGCNFETFSKHGMIELETLGALRTLAPGESTEHSETWHLFGGVQPPDTVDEDILEEWLRPFLTKLGIS